MDIDKVIFYQIIALTQLTCIVSLAHTEQVQEQKQVHEEIQFF